MMNSSTFIPNKYTKWYFSIINEAANKPPGENQATHHIIPECFYIHRKRKGPAGWLEGDPDHPSNKVALSNKAHLTCHKLLVKMTHGKAKSKMYYALSMLQNKGAKLTGKQYQLMREDMARTLNEYWTIERREQKSIDCSGEKGPFYGKHHSEENKKKSRERTFGKTFVELYGEEVAGRMKLAVSVRNKGEGNPFYNKTHSDKSLIKMKEEAKKPKSEAWKESASRNRKGKVPINNGKTHEELYGVEKAKELKKKQSLPGEKNGFYGKHHTSEQRAKKSAEKLAAPKKMCYHCAKEVDHMNYSRWHGDNCKYKK